MALCVAGEVARRGVVDYAIGGFAAAARHRLPHRCARRDDGAADLVHRRVLAALYSGHAPATPRCARKSSTLFQAGFLLCLAGLLGVVVDRRCVQRLRLSRGLLDRNLRAGRHRRTRDRRALPAAFNYLIMGTIGATFFVIGVGFLYAATGTLNMADIAARVATLTDSRAVQAGFAFIVVGLGLKAAMFPLHGWLPGAYAYAPSLIAGLPVGDRDQGGDLSARALRLHACSIRRRLRRQLPDLGAGAAGRRGRDRLLACRRPSRQSSGACWPSPPSRRSASSCSAFRWPALAGALRRPAPC